MVRAAPNLGLSDASYVEIEVARGRLQSIVDEAGQVLIRTAFSQGVREAKDFACALLSRDGLTVVQSSQSIPVFLGTMTRTAQRLLARFPVAEFSPGDVVATNDPWQGTGHLFDLSVLAPIFVGDDVVAFAGVVAHLPDIGGRGFAIDSRQVFEEGLQIPPLKIVTRSRIDPVFENILRANVRLPDEVMGDLAAILNASTVMATRLGGLCSELSVGGFYRVCKELEQRTETFVRDTISGLPDGLYRAEIQSEGVSGVPFQIRLQVAVRGDEIELDFAGSSAQVESAANACYGYSRAYAIFALKCLLAPRLPFNEGFVRPIRVTAPEHTVVNSTFPAAGAARNLVGHFIPALVIDAIGNLLPGCAIGQCGSPIPSARVNGLDPNVGMFSAPFQIMGGFGARASKDGPSCLAFPPNPETVPVEMMESMCPLIFEEKELVPDSGGAGQFRGGLGQRVTIRCETPHAQAFVLAQRLHAGPAGIRAGCAGERTHIAVSGAEIRTFTGPLDLRFGDTLTIQSPGGGGLGPPKSRERERVLDDLRSGYITKAAAVGLYGLDGSHLAESRVGGPK